MGIAKSNKIFVLNIVVKVLNVPRVDQGVDDKDIGIELASSCKDGVNNCLIEARPARIPAGIALAEADFHGPDVVVGESPLNVKGIVERSTPFTPRANICLLPALKEKVDPFGSKAFSVLNYQATSVLVMVLIAWLAKRIRNIVTTIRDMIPPETVL